MKDRMPKIGDRIKMKQDIFVGFDRAYNAIGTIRYFDGLDFLVEFDENIDGHDGCGECRCVEDHGWFVNIWMFNIIHEKYYPSVVTNIIGAH